MGKTDPEGIVTASVGRFYINTTTSNLFFKSVGIDAFGWVKIDSELNLKEGVDYLSPLGDASQLKNLNMSNAGSGLLSVSRGGTGAANINGIIKGNGTSACSAAIDGTDYLGPAAMVGVISFYPVAKIPTGWLKCDGAAYSRITYARLFNVIGTTYGAGDGSTTFNVPNLYNYFVRGWDGESDFNTVQQDQVGAHTHSLTGNTDEESAHTHTRGNMNITGSHTNTTYPYSDISDSPTYDGCLYCDIATLLADAHTSSSYIGATSKVYFDASRTWTGNTSGGSPHSHTLSGNTGSNAEVGTETRVINKMLVPIIKY